MSISEVLQRITVALDQNNVSYMLTGSFASAYYGTPRSTQDIDVIVEATPAQLRAFVNSLPFDQYYSDLDAALQAHKAESMFNVIDRSTGWKIDFIIRKSRPFSHEEFRRRVRVNLQGVSLFVASTEDVVIAKLEWSKLAQSQRQIDDVAQSCEHEERPWIVPTSRSGQANSTSKTSGEKLGSQQGYSCRGLTTSLPPT